MKAFRIRYMSFTSPIYGEYFTGFWKAQTGDPSLYLRSSFAQASCGVPPTCGFAGLRRSNGTYPAKHFGTYVIIEYKASDDKKSYNIWGMWSTWKLCYSGPVAQWLAQATHNRLVAGSNPAGPIFCTSFKLLLT